MKPKLHVLFPFHTEPNETYSHCAFTGKAERFIEMMSAQGYNVVEYSNGRSCSSKFAAERYEILTHERLESLKAEHNSNGVFHGDYAVIGSKLFHTFDAELKKVFSKNVKTNDIVCHPFGHAHADLANVAGIHVETGIGYPTTWSKFRIFESSAWMNYISAKTDSHGRSYEWVVPNYYRPEDWPTVLENTNEPPYVLFAGRVTECKGMATLAAIASYGKIPIMVAGQGDLSPWSAMLGEQDKHLLKYIGDLKGAERAKIYGNAKVFVAPSNFIEPFCGVAVEAMMTGTPVVATHFGAFAETIEHGKTGYRCHVLNDYIEGIKRAESLDRKYISDRAKKLYSLETCGKKYDAIFRQIYDLHTGGGWYTCPHVLDDNI